MADGLNRVMLLGSLGADPDLKMTPGGQAILKLRMATSESYLDKNNARQERTEWHSVTVWGRRGEALAKILAKGSTIFVEGGLRTSSFEKDGEKRYRTEVVATNIILAGGKRPVGGDSQSAPQGQRAPQQQRKAAPEPEYDDFNGGDSSDDPIPF